MISSNDERIILQKIKHHKEFSSQNWIMFDREDVRTQPKRLAYWCYCNGFTFHWSNQKYYIGNICKDQWQPIETAPKDGTRILLYKPCKDFQSRPSIGFFGNGLWVAESDEEFYIEESQNGELTAFDDYSPGTIWKPEYWMPLPKFPEEGAKKYE